MLVCAPTGTGKTLIAEAAIFEALHTGKRAYYTTPLIALTEQKLSEIRQSAVRWGFSPDDVGSSQEIAASILMPGSWWSLRRYSSIGFYIARRSTLRTSRPS